MKTKLHHLLLTQALLLLSTINLQLSTAFAQGTAFTYQGRLNSGGSPASGTYNLTFSLFNTNTGGAAIAGPVTNNAVVVTNGLFTVTIDFGPGVFTGQTNWLQIGVETNGVSTFTPLTPRQQLTPTPYAIYAESANAAALSGTIPLAQLPGAVVTNNNAVSVTLSGSFTGNGSGLTSVNAAALNGLNAASFWQLGGNNVSAGQFLGSTDDQPLELWANNTRALRLEPGGVSAYLGNGTPTGAPNVVGGARVNYVASGVVGAVIGGGGATNYGGASYTNSVSADLSFLGGGYGNSIQAGAFDSVIGGGYNNSLYASFSFLGGGYGNWIQPNTTLSFLGGGNGNSIQYGANWSFLGGGYGNYIQPNDDGCFLGCGYNNSIQLYSSYSFLGGGYANSILGPYAVIPGGATNTAWGSYSTVPGGSLNVAQGTFSFAAGQQAHANNQGAFVWADSQNGTYSSWANDQFCIRAQGGVQLDPTTSLSFGTATRQMLNLYGSTYGIGVQAGTLFFRSDATYASSGDFSWFRGGSWNNGQNNPGSGGAEMMRLDHLGNLNVSNNVVAHSLILASDRNLKSNFMPVNTQEVLAKVAALPITAWDFKSETGVQHIGPMAQDFYAAFSVGADDKHIAVVDEGGVALAAIQGLNQKLENELKAKDAEIQELKARLEKLEQVLETRNGGGQ